MAFKKCKNGCGEISVCDGMCKTCIKERLKKLDNLTRCSSCKGAKVRWYSLYGMDTCHECHGTGEKRP